MFYHAPLVHAFGGQILDENGRPAIDSVPSVRALALVRSWQDEHLVPDEATNTVAAQLFNDGQAAMTINGPWFAGEIAPGVPWAVAPLPVLSPTGRRLKPLVTVEGLFLPARAHQAEAALGFARWLSGGDGATDGVLWRALDGKQTVAAKAAWDDPRVRSDAFLQAFRAQLPDTEPLPNRPEMRAVWEPAQQALRKVLRGAADPRSALAAAEREILEALRPPPPAAPMLPWSLAGSACLAAVLIVLYRRLKRRGGVEAIARHRWAYAYLLPAALAMVVLVFVPFAVGAGMSLFHYKPAGGGHWMFVGLRNFGDILASRQGPVFAPLSFYYTLGVTALWTLANITLHVAIGVTLALLLRDPLLKLRGVYRVLLIVPWAVPNYITALIWKGMFHRQFGAVNGLLAALGLTPVAWFSRFWTAFAANLTTNVWLGFPFMMVVTLGALARIPRELEEAAALDGASRWQRLYHVVLPLLLPALIPSVLLGAVWTFNMFNIVFLVSGGEPDGATEILVSQAYRWAFSRGHRYGYAAAYAVLIFAVLAIQSALFKQKSDEAGA
jgi:arabinogalactan oligomer/maltooligosaccharide transport system permease protein